MIVEVYSGDRGVADSPIFTLRVEGRSVYLGDDLFGNAPILTIEQNVIYAGAKELVDQVEPAATVIGNEIYRGRVAHPDVKDGGFEPLATIVGKNASFYIYLGRRDYGAKPRALVEGGDVMSAACAAVHLRSIGLTF